MTAIAAPAWWQAALAPRSVAVIGASDNPNKVGGRPIQYMRRFGYSGRILPINPARREVQELPAFSGLRDLDGRPDLAVIAVPAAGALDAVRDCAALNVPAAVVLSSGFAEVGAEGRAVQAEMASTARRAGMRLIGPNTQGIANFATGAIASFATLFGEIAPQDGPVAIVSQSGAMSVVPYAHLRRAGIGVRYAHATGNEADVSVPDLAASALADPSIRLLLLYMEHVENPAGMAAMAAQAHARDVPVLVLKSGRSARGAQAAASHTGVLATEDRVVDAFFRQHGILRVEDMQELVVAAELFLASPRPRGKRLGIVSNSGASCVMAADLADRHGLDVPPLSEAVRQRLAAVLPAFANPDNPIDLTGALLSHSALFGDTLALLASENVADLLLVSLPNAGQGYDVAGFASATAAFLRDAGTPAAVATPNPSSAEAFRSVGLPTFNHDSDAIAALAQVAHWSALRANAAEPASPAETFPQTFQFAASDRFASEWDSLAILRTNGFPLPAMALAQSQEEARAAAETLRPPFVVKGCSADLPHKSEHGLVKLGLLTPDAVAEAAAQMASAVRRLRGRNQGVIVAEQVRADLELLLGARRDGKFGVVITVGAGGTMVEALDDVAVVLAPFTDRAAAQALASLTIARLFASARGKPAIEVPPLIALMRRLGALMAAQPEIASIDLNPVLAIRGGEPVIADALIEFREKDA